MSEFLFIAFLATGSERIKGIKRKLMEDYFERNSPIGDTWRERHQ